MTSLNTASKPYIKSLIVSVALNCFLVGFLMHPIVFHPFGSPPMQGMPPMMAGMPPNDMMPDPSIILRHVAKDLSPQGQVTLSKIIDAHKDQLVKAQYKIHEAFVNLHEMIDQDQADDKALQEAIDKVGLAQNDVHQSIAAIFLAVHHEMSPEDRKILKKHFDPPM